MNKLFFVGIVLFSFVLFFGCTETDLVIPYTTGQLINASTDVNYSLFRQGDNNGQLVYVDWNKLGFISPSDLNISSGSGSSIVDTNWLNSPPQDGEEICFGNDNDICLNFDGSRYIIDLGNNPYFDVTSDVANFFEVKSTTDSSAMVVNTEASTNNKFAYYLFRNDGTNKYGYIYRQATGDFYIYNYGDARYILRDDLSTDELLLMETEGSVVLPRDNELLELGAGRDSYFTYDGTNLVANPRAVGTGVFYVDGNVSAEAYLTHSYVYDKEKGSALDLIKDSDNWKKDDDSIDYKKHYAGTSILVTDYTKPKIEKKCDLELEAGENELKCKDVVTYPYKIEKEGLDVETRLATLEQAVYELNEKNNVLLEENDLIKTELCKTNSSYAWCKKTIK